MTEPLNTDRSWSYVTSEGSKLPPGVSTQWNPSPKAQSHLMKSDTDQAEDSVVWDFSKKKFVLFLWKDLFVEMAGCPSPARCSPFPSAHSYGPLPQNLLAKGHSRARCTYEDPASKSQLTTYWAVKDGSYLQTGDKLQCTPEASPTPFTHWSFHLKL